MLRMDLIHPHISGNKWFKLKYNIQKAKDNGFQNILTFGGAYSNHIYATAAACAKENIGCIGVIRGEEHLPLNPTLQYAAEKGMILHYLSRSDYRKKITSGILNNLREQFGDFFLVPEGGSNALAVKGMAEVPIALGEDYDLWVTPIGTGGTMAGIISGLKEEDKVFGFSALKGAYDLKDSISALLCRDTEEARWAINHDFHFGGYAKMTPELMNFIVKFRDDYKILLDPIYTSKMMFGLFSLLDKKAIAEKKIMVLHTGGLQGWLGMQRRYDFVPDLFPFNGS